MPIARVQLPDGRIGRFEVPEGTTPQQVESFALEQFNAKPKQAEPQPSLADRAARVAGLGGRALISGVSAIPTLMADAAAGAVNLGIEGVNKIADAVTPNGMGDLVTGKKPLIDYRMQAPSAVLNRTMTAAGLPEPANAVERFATNVSGSMAGAAAPAAVASGVAPYVVDPAKRAIAELLGKNMGLQVVSAGTGTAAGDIARESGAGPVGQVAATLAGSVAPAALQTAASAAVRGMVRGGEQGRRTVQENIDAFKAAGTTPTVGQATERRGPRFAETTMAKTPGSAGVIANKAEQQSGQIGTRVDEIAQGLSNKIGAEDAGREIKAGITGDAGFKQWFEARQKSLYDALDAYIKPQDRVDVTATKNALANLNADIPGAPNVSRMFKNAKIQGIEAAMKADTEGTAGVAAQIPAWQSLLLDQLPKVQRETILQGFADGKLPYEAVKKLRTLVGREMNSGSLVAEVPRDKWKELYAALSDDLRNVADEAGPDAFKAWKRANDFTRAGIGRLETLDTVLGGRDPEDIFRAAMAGTQEGATTLRAVMKSLPEPAQKSVAATVLKRMGMATPGRQNELGDVFSPETFLTNWNRLSPEAKITLFSKYGPDFNKNLDQIAKVASNIREGSKVFANPSGTGATVTGQIGVGGLIASMIFGDVATTAALGGGMLAANVASRKLMTNPDFVRWLAQETKVPSGSLQGAAAALETLSRKQGPEDAASMRELAVQLKQMRTEAPR